MNDRDKKMIQSGVEEMASNALRVIAVGYKDIVDSSIFNDDNESDINGVYDYETKDIIFIGLFGIIDVLRDDVEASVIKCRNAGINVRMITGDSSLTATAIAKKCGILKANDNSSNRVMDGRLFMESIEGVICSYCRTVKCGCIMKEETSTSDTTKKDDKVIEVDGVKLGFVNDKNKSNSKDKINPNESLRNGEKKPSSLKISADKQGGLLGKKDKGDIKVKFKEENEIFEDTALNRKSSGKNKKPSKRIRVDTIKNGKEFERIMSTLKVLARSRPEDKYAIVVGLKERGHIVAVTGDGTNDAPALSKADVGFAMGKSGTDIAKSAADIIITDDNFSSIVSAVVRGRNIYDCIRKFLSFQLTVNVVAVVGTFLGGLLLNNAIISAVQMLWVNLIMDTLASLALATEPPNAEDLLKRKPYLRESSLLSKKMMKHILGQSLFQLSVLTIIIFEGKSIFNQIDYTLFDKGKIR